MSCDRDWEDVMALRSARAINSWQSRRACVDATSTDCRNESWTISPEVMMGGVVGVAESLRR